MIDLFITLLENDLVPCDEMSLEDYLQIWTKAGEPTSAATAATAGLRGAGSSISLGKRKPLKKSNSVLDPLEATGPKIA